MTARTFDREKCAQRDRLAVHRDTINAFPVRFLAGAPADEGPRPVSALGTLPATDAEALARINAGLPAGAPPLTEADIYIHYALVANNTFLSDRWMFLHRSTLRNIATDAATATAFMNSHRTGGLSHPAELPMGRTFAGRFEQYGDGTMRTLVGMYMQVGLAPNGAQGPTTDDLHRMIWGGTLFDCSVGLNGGEAICDVCGANLDDDGCAHAPGTNHKMTVEEQVAQQARGVPDGQATYSLWDAHLGEYSGVYDGAVSGAGYTYAPVFDRALPGSGYAKLRRLARGHALSRDEIRQARHAYAGILNQGELDMAEQHLVDLIAAGVGRALGRGTALGADEAEADAAAPVSAEPTPAPAPEAAVAPEPEPEPEFVVGESLTALRPFDVTATPEYQAQQAKLARLEAQELARAATWADERWEALVKSHRCYPHRRAAFLTLCADLAADDLARPLAGTSRQEQLAALLGENPQHALTQEQVGSLYVLPTVQVGAKAETEATAFQAGYEQGRRYGGPNGKAPNGHN
jgi:hypothetical protein